MAQEHDWLYDLAEYILQGEPDRSEKSAAWQAAIPELIYHDAHPFPVLFPMVIIAYAL